VQPAPGNEFPGNGSSGNGGHGNGGPGNGGPGNGGPGNGGWDATAHRVRGRRRSPWPGRFMQVVMGVAAVSVFLLATTAQAQLNHFVKNAKKTRIHTSQAKGTTAVAPTKYGAMNVLLLGIDSRAGLSAAEIAKYHLGSVGLGGSDTIMLVHLSSKRDQATIVSFPRDLYVTIPQFTTSDNVTHSQVKMKINAAYPRGGADGPALTVATIEQLTGLHIDHYMSIDVPHLGRMVDALGGVTVCLPQAINDPVRNGHGSGLVLSAGVHTLNDVQAVGYVRARYIDTGEGSSDFGRIRRQQKFMSAMLKKVTSAGTLTDPSKLTNFLNTVSDAVTMDDQLTQKDLFTIANQLHSLDPKHVTFTTVPIVNDNYVVPGVGDTVLADPQSSAALYHALAEDQPVGTADYKSAPKTLKPSQVSVRVLNGGGPVGSARRTATELATMGFQNGGAPVNADRNDYATTTIHYPATKISDARTLQLAVPNAVLKQDDSVSVVTLVIGKDFTGTTPIPTASAAPAPVVTHSAADAVCTKN
jgi:LCP family protein required for cell wall assembly